MHRSAEIDQRWATLRDLPVLAFSRALVRDAEYATTGNQDLANCTQRSAIAGLVQRFILSMARLSLEPWVPARRATGDRSHSLG